MTHDPLCTTVLNSEMSEAFCNCDLIARVREDQRQSDAYELDAKRQYAAALSAARDAVAAAYAARATTAAYATADAADAADAAAYVAWLASIIDIYDELSGQKDHREVSDEELSALALAVRAVYKDKPITAVTW